MENKLIRFYVGDAGRELQSKGEENGWTFKEMLWAINLALCSKPFEVEDIPKLVSLLIEINPYLLVDIEEYPDSYSAKAITLFNAGLFLNPQKVDDYKKVLSNVLSKRTLYCETIIPHIYKQLII